MTVRRPKNLPDGRTVLSATLGLARGAPPVSEKDSSVGALALGPEDGFARRLPQNDTDRRHAVFSRVRYYTRSGERIGTQPQRNRKIGSSLFL